MSRPQRTLSSPLAHRAVRFALLLLPSCAACWGLIQLARFSPQELFPFWLWPLALLCAFASFRFFSLAPCREKTAGVLYALALLFVQLVGRQFDFPAPDGVLSSGEPLTWLYALLCAAGLSPALGWPVALLLKKLGKTAAKASPLPVLRKSSGALTHAETDGSSAAAPFHRGRYFFTCLAVLFLLWLPCHLAYFPGLAEYDSGYQFWQSWNGVYNASNPLFHTFILGFFYLTGDSLGSVSGGLAVLGFLQQLFMAGCLSYALTVLRKNGASRWLCRLSLLFFGALPVFCLMSISFTKDVPFYCLVTLQLTLIYDLCHRPDAVTKVRCWLLPGIVTLLACLFRANALGAMFLLPPLVCLVCKNKAFRRRLFCAMMGGTILAWGLNTLFISLVQAESTLLRESLNVPIIQMARVSQYHEDAAQDLQDNHSDLVSLPMAYIPYVVDLAKWNWNVDSKNLGSFLSLWAQWGAAYPMDYADAALLLTKGYWYLWDRSYAKVYGETYEQHYGAIPSRVSAGIDKIEETCLLPGYYEHMEHMYSENHYLDIPVYRLLLCPSLYVWLLLLAALAALCQRRRDVRLPARVCCLYLVALLLGPCCILRYALLLMFMTPLLFCMLTGKSEGQALVP